MSPGPVCQAQQHLSCISVLGTHSGNTETLLWWKNQSNNREPTHSQYTWQGQNSKLQEVTKERTPRHYPNLLCWVWHQKASQNPVQRRATEQLAHRSWWLLTRNCSGLQKALDDHWRVQRNAEITPQIPIPLPFGSAVVEKRVSIVQLHSCSEHPTQSRHMYFLPGQSGQNRWVTNLLA